MTKRRNFNQSERSALFIHADGKCQNCGKDLEVGWHADHVHPYSKGGDTDILNGQALCDDCNRKKGNKVVMTKQAIELREFQERFIDRAVEKAKKGIKELVCNVCAGSGKTLGSQAAADKLMQLGFIEQVVCFVPRLNLAAQYELDWEFARDKLPYPPTMSGLNHTDNTLPLLYKGSSGYVTTYASLCADPALHIKAIAKKKTLLILDEAHQLGIDEMGIDGTQSAKWVEECAKHAVMIFVMSGTPYRSDGKPLLFAYPDYYAEPDINGYRRLLPDLEATYRDGVREGYLRRFEATLADGGYTWVDVAGNMVKYTLSESEASVYQALQLTDVWQPLVDKFVDKLQDQKATVDSRLCGLIACGYQDQATEVEQYLKRNHSHLRVVKAISKDGKDAQTALRNFKSGKYDVLVTVSMAYVGYDHKPINTILMLTHFRSIGYLEQLLARGLRVMPDIPLERQACHLIVPDDPDMTKFVEYMRGESDAGYSERREHKTQQESGDDTHDFTSTTLGYATDGYISALRAMGIDPLGDIDAIDWEYAEQLRRSMGLPYPATDLIAFHRRWMERPITHKPIPVPTKTLKEQIEDAKQELTKQVTELTGIIARDSGNYDTAEIKRRINRRLFDMYKSVQKVSSVEEVRQRSVTVLKWIEKRGIDDEQ